MGGPVAGIGATWSRRTAPELPSRTWASCQCAGPTRTAAREGTSRPASDCYVDATWDTLH